MSESVLKDMEDEVGEKLSAEASFDLLTSFPGLRKIDFPKYKKPEVELESLFDLEGSSVRTGIGIERDAKTGKILSYKEVFPEGEGTALSSLSLKRAPADPAQGLMGSSSNKPFLPGGFEDDLLELLDETEDKLKNLDSEVDCFLNPTLLTCPPGFERGFDFAAQADLVEEKDEEEEDEFDALMDLISAPGFRLESPPEKEEIASSVDDNQNLEQEVISKAAIKRKKEKDGVKKKIYVEPKHQFATYLDTRSSVPNFENQIPNPARTYPFKLDPFQQEAVLCLEKGDMAAHTSAGKTVVAEYAVALCQRHLTRAIYTSPIKALSNQKFREFKLAFDDVGLITGDIQIHPEAFCLIMTTEILRSMLYNGSEVVRELEWLIFDEVHYINDSERGVVWEEVLIMLPSHIKIVMLSATVPNTMEFADWVGRIKNRKIFVISTAKRPVPLEHFLYTGTDGKTKDNRFLIVDQDRNFLNHGYKAACESRAPKKGGGPGKFSAGNNPKGDRNILITLINHLETKELLPVVVFTFSRKRCDENAASLTSTDLTTSVEKTEIHHFFSRCVRQLKGLDRRLPQVLQMQELCKRGIAVHHSGILPLLKEVVELLFQQGFVKVLFATETFAMGVNMPARTVVFDSMQKHDGQRKRDLNPGEYVQMAGRAGRRGLDSTGTVILLCKWGPIPEAGELHTMMLGKPTMLESKFRVTYSMLLNLLRVEQLRVEDMLKRSFAESSSLKLLSSKKEELRNLSSSLSAVESLNCAACTEGGIEGFFQLAKHIVTESRELWKSLLGFGLLGKLLVPGRLLLFSCGEEFRNRLSILLRIASGSDTLERVLTILLPLNPDETRPQLESVDPKPETRRRIWDIAIGRSVSVPANSPDPAFCVVDVSSNFIVGILSRTQKLNALAVLEDDIRRSQPRFRNQSPDRTVINSVRDLLLSGKSLAEAPLPLVAPKEVQCSDIDVMTRSQRLAEDEHSLNSFTCVHCLSFPEHFAHVQSVAELRETKRELEFSLSSKNLLLLPEYKRKLKVLQSFGYVDASNLVELKGKVACEIHQEELLVTELMLENVLGALSPPEIAAVLSCTTCQFRDKDVPLSPHMAELKALTMSVATKIAERQRTFGVTEDDPTEYLRFDLMEVVYEWARGMPFAQIMDLTTAQEGIIVRCIQRLGEVIKDVRNGARIVGDPNLQSKMEETSTAIKRDIVFAASLYTTNNAATVEETS